MKRKLLVGMVLSLLLPTSSVLAAETQPTVSIEADSAILYQPETKDILFEKNADQQYPTASLAKVMTMLIASEAIKDGKIKKTDMVTISKKAWLTGGSRMFLEVGTRYSVEDLFKGLAVVSGNDAAVALSEHIAGSTDDFVVLMNKKAQELGMNHTHFYSVNGLPGDHEPDVSTARDLMILTDYYMEKFPENKKIHQMKSYTTQTKENPIKQFNHNPLITDKYPGATGLKTGYVSQHYNVIGTVEQNGLSFIAVVLKAPTDGARTRSTFKLLNYGFNQYTTVVKGKKGDVIDELRVYYADASKKTNVVLGEDVKIGIKKTDVDKIKIKNKLPDHLKGGLKDGDVVGKQIVTIDDKKLEYDLVVTEDVEESGPIQKMFDGIAVLARTLIHMVFD